MVSRQTSQIKAFSVFICYEHTDEHLCQEFKKHLAPLQLSGTIAEVRDRNMIQPGQDIERAILAYLDRADVVFLLLSSDFVASTSCMRQAEYAKQRCANTSSIIPIYIRQLHWEGLPFAGLQGLPKDGTAVNDFPDRDRVWTEITRYVSEVLTTLSPEHEQVLLLEHSLREGQAVFEQEQHEDALRVYQHIIQIKPNLAVAHSFLGQILYKLERYEDALRACEQAIQLGSQLADTYDYQGLTRYRLGQYEEAIEAFDQAVRLAPNHAQAYDHKAHVLCRLRRPEEARACCNQALTYNARLASAYDNRSWALYQLQQYPDALKDCERAIQLDSELVTAYYNQGRALYMLGRDQEALRACEEAIKLYKQRKAQGKGAMHLLRSLASVYITEGKAYIELGCGNEALQSCEQAIEAYEQVMKAYEQAIETHQESLRSTRTIAFYRQTIKTIRQEHAEAYARKGEALLVRGSFHKALETFKDVIQRYDEVMQPGTADYERLMATVYANKGHAHLKLERPQRAITDCDEALRHDRGLCRAYSIKVEALEKRRRYEEAAEVRRIASNFHCY